MLLSFLLWLLLGLLRSETLADQRASGHCGAGGWWVGAGDAQRIVAQLRGGADANAERTDFGAKMRRLMQNLSSGPAGRAVKN